MSDTTVLLPVEGKRTRDQFRVPYGAGKKASPEPRQEKTTRRKAASEAIMSSTEV